MRHLCLVLFVPSILSARADEVRFAEAPQVTRSGGDVTLSFTVNQATDVEIAVLDAKDRVVRHLAAGVLGGKNPPPAPLRPGLGQKITWDGNDDGGTKA